MIVPQKTKSVLHKSSYAASEDIFYTLPKHSKITCNMKKTLKSISLFGAISALFLTVSCTKEYLQTPPPPDPNIPVSFSADMQPFFDARCVSCHGSIDPNLEASVAYENLIQGGFINLATPENSLLYTKINVGGTMEGYASAAERQMTLLWIKQGALNN